MAGKSPGSAPEYLSAEELRNRLYHSLRNRGLVNSIKSQLRNSLVTELQQSIQGPLTLKDLHIPEGGSLLHRASNSLVANHLRACKYEYTLSVFLPECGLDQDKKFETADLLKLLNINSDSRLYERLNNQTKGDNKQGFLWKLLSEVCSLHGNSVNSLGCQTELIKVGPIIPLDEKLSDVDELYSSRRDEILSTGRAGAEERMLNFQRQLEDRYNTQLKLEVSRIRDSEIASIKLEEKENGRKALEQARRDLERIYRDKHEALVLRERNATERLQQQLELQERETYAQRQTILEEIEAVRHRQSDVKREAEAYEREKKLLESRIRDKEADLRRRELEIQQKESSFESRLQNEMAQFKLDQQTKYIDRIQHIEAREAAVKEGERTLSEERARLQQIKDELRDKTHRVNELETQLSEAKYSEINANKNNEYLNTKLRDMSDYKTVKEQVVLYRSELETLRTRLAEVMSMNERERGRQEELLRELRRPSPESLMLQRDLEKAKESLRQEEIVFKQQKQLLETRLKEELDRNRDLLQNFEEQTQQMKEMNREIVDLRQHLHMTQRALNTEVYQKPQEEQNKPLSNESRHAQRGKNSSKVSTDLNLDTPLARRTLRFEGDGKDVYHDAEFDFHVLPKAGGGGDYCDEEVSSVDSADVVAHAKYRLMNLDKEAHNLERAYHDFHCRLTNINCLPNDVMSKEPGQSSTKMTDEMLSPRQSPILFDHPMSSTPYKQPRKFQDFNDSFSELSTRPQKQRHTDPPRSSLPTFDLSAGDTKVDHRILEKEDEERKVRMRAITVDDLEQRPGSPGIVVIAESVSSEEGKKVAGSVIEGKFQAVPVVTSAPAAQEAVQLPDRQVRVEGAIVPGPSPADQLVSLDAAWRSQQEEHVAETVLNKVQNKVDLGEHMAVEKQEQSHLFATVDDKQKDEDVDDKIDPVMKAYMARVFKQKEREKEQAKALVASSFQNQPLVKTPHQSESEDLSFVADDKSEQEDSW